MPVRRGNNGRRSSKQDVALMQMQIAAQARNQHWHDFLCGKRDELQARLRQQGYSEAGFPGAGKQEPDVTPGMQRAHSDETPRPPGRWGVAEVEAEGTPGADHYQADSRVGGPARAAESESALEE